MTDRPGFSPINPGNNQLVSAYNNLDKKDKSNNRVLVASLTGNNEDQIRGHTDGLLSATRRLFQKKVYNGVLGNFSDDEKTIAHTKSYERKLNNRRMRSANARDQSLNLAAHDAGELFADKLKSRFEHLRKGKFKANDMKLMRNYVVGYHRYLRNDAPNKDAHYQMRNFSEKLRFESGPKEIRDRVDEFIEDYGDILQPHELSYLNTVRSSMDEDRMKLRGITNNPNASPSEEPPVAAEVRRLRDQIADRIEDWADSGIEKTVDEALVKLDQMFGVDKASD